MKGTNNYATWLRWIEQYPDKETKIVIRGNQPLYCIDVETPEITDAMLERIATLMPQSLKAMFQSYGLVIKEGQVFFYVLHNMEMYTLKYSLITDRHKLLVLLADLLNDGQ